MIYETAKHLSPEPHDANSPVQGTDANGNTETTMLGAPHPFRQPEDGIAGFLSRGGVVEPYLKPEISPAPTVPSLYAIAHLTVANGDITGIGINSRFIGAHYQDVGRYCLFFAETQPDTSYLAKAYGDASRIKVTEKAQGHIVIGAADYSGAPTDPTEFSVEIIRVG